MNFDFISGINALGGGVLGYVIPFLFVLTLVVFFHELGHFLIARWCGVRVLVFSIGFGPELFGKFDRHGTRWKISAIPLGGYVKMFGDADAASTPSAALGTMNEADRSVSFHHKRLGQRAAILFAGPAANFIFAVVLLAGLFSTVGEPFMPPDVGQVVPGSAAEAGGIKNGDVILSIDGGSVERFEDVQQAVMQNAAGSPMTIVVRRDDKPITLSVTPHMTETTDRFGNKSHVGVLGIQRSGMNYLRRDPLTAVWRATRETSNLVTSTLKGVGQMIVGTRTTDELGGPLRIAQMSGEVAQGGIVPLLWFMAVLSVNLGLINLFPIPILDGGHLLFYAAEALRGRPLGQRAQEFGFRIGLALVLTLMVFATWNDLVHLQIVAFIKGLVT